MSGGAELNTVSCPPQSSPAHCTETIELSEQLAQKAAWDAPRGWASGLKKREKKSYIMNFCLVMGIKIRRDRRDQEFGYLLEFSEAESTSGNIYLYICTWKLEV